MDPVALSAETGPREREPSPRRVETTYCLVSRLRRNTLCLEWLLSNGHRMKADTPDWGGSYLKLRPAIAQRMQALQVTVPAV